MKYETSIEKYEVAEGKVSINGIKWLPRWDVKVTFEKKYEAVAFQKKLEQPEDEPVCERCNDVIVYSNAGVCANCLSAANTRPQPAAATEREYMEADAVEALTESGWMWDGDQWQRPRVQKSAACVGLTDDATYAAVEIAWRAGWAACRDAEFVGEEAEHDAWGYQGATVAQDAEAKLREKNGGAA